MEIERWICVDQPLPGDLEEGMIPCPPDEKMTWWNIYNRPDPFETVPRVVLISARIVCLPVWLVHRIFPLRYFTSVYHIFCIVYLSLYVTKTWKNDWIQGVLWIMCLFVPPASSFIFCLATGLREAAIKRLGTTLFIDYHLLSHVVPSAFVFLVTDVPHPPVLVSSALFLGLALVYLLYLRLVYRMSIQDNYFIADQRKRPIALLSWFLCWILACITAECLFRFTESHTFVDG